MRRFRPMVSRRPPSGTHFAELFLAPGPEAIGQTGDNSYSALFGRTWLLVWDREDMRLHLYQEALDGSWTEVTADLPPVFSSPVPAGSRRFSLAFDQSARVVIAYEESAGVVTGTRWDASEGEYKQNIDFLGTDPVLFIDASVADPAISPEEAIRQAFSYGWGVVYQWTPTGQWLENPVVDSDVVVFYLSPDRTELRARVQRQLYQQEHLLHTFDQPVILDRVVALFGQYQALVSGADGEPLANALISDAYFTDVLPVYPADERLSAGVAPENLRAESDTYNVTDEDTLDASVTPENLAVVGSLYPATDSDELDASVQPENLAAVSSVYPTAPGDALDAGVQPEGIEARVMVIPASDEDALTGGITVENIRVQTV